jgi:hypothetical protein
MYSSILLYLIQKGYSLGYGFKEETGYRRQLQQLSRKAISSQSWICAKSSTKDEENVSYH